MITFTAIRWKNFLSTGNTFSEIRLDQGRLNFLTGNSGHGKSTFLDAITFAIFNKPYRSVTKAHLVNSINDKHCLVELEFTIGKVNYMVRRGIKPTVFEIYADGILVNQDAKSMDYQHYLETKILKMNMKTFKQVVALGRAEFVPFMKLTPSDRRIIIEEILDITVFSTMKGILKTRYDELKTRIRTNASGLDNIATKIEMQKTHIQSMKVDNSARIKEKEVEIETLTADMEKVVTEIATLREQIDVMRAGISVPSSELVDAINKCKQVESRCKSKIAGLQKQIDFYKTNTTCSECKQHIQEDFIAGRVSGFQAEIAEHQSKIDEQAPVIKKVEAKLAKVKAQEMLVSEEERKLRQLEADVRQQKAIIARVASEVASLKKPSGEVTRERDKLNDFKLKQTELEEEKKKLLFDDHLYELSNELLKDNGVKAKIINQYLPLINGFTNQFLNAMNFFVSFNLDEEFKEKIQSRKRDDFVYACFSEGEKQRIDMATMFTWRMIAKTKNSLSTNLLILDEVSDSYLNQEATDNMIDMFKSDIMKDTNLFVLTHKDTILDRGDRVIRFVHENNFSRIVS